jgi:hypothetical protein
MLIEPWLVPLLALLGLDQLVQELLHLQGHNSTRDESTSVAAQLLVTKKDRCKKKRAPRRAFSKAIGSRDLIEHAHLVCA